MTESIWNLLGIDPFYIILGQAGLTLILTIVVIVCIFKIRKLYRIYDYFMRGRDAETLEDIIIEHIQDIQELKSQDHANKDQIRTNNKNMRASFQKFGVVRYNAFKGMGGNLSFAFALLDYTNTGFILNSVHNREGCYLYLKTVDRGQTEIMLGNEEKEALEQALGYKKLKDM
ncbi:DUF4446 family protein [Clostridiaceae bacterium]|nr:DUF4446 family protein [Clostridiaceae bacterium]RKI16010.1 DUF4446 family protein [bacterium 1XD21-70]